MKNKIIKIINFIAKTASIFMIIIFLTFFIGEGLLGNLSLLTTEEIMLLILIPGILFIGTFIAWKKEFIGGLIMCLSIIIFNVIEMIFSKDHTLSTNFWLFFIIGLLFIIIGILKQKKKI